MVQVPYENYYHAWKIARNFVVVCCRYALWRVLLIHGTQRQLCKCSMVLIRCWDCDGIWYMAIESLRKKENSFTFCCRLLGFASYMAYTWASKGLPSCDFGAHVCPVVVIYTICAVSLKFLRSLEVA